MFGELNKQEIETLLHKEFICRLGCHAEGLTYIVPLSYAYDGEYIYGHTYEGMKVNMMRKNPQVCVEIDDMHNMANWQSAIGWGIFEELKGTEREHALGVLMTRALPIIHSETMHLSPQWPFKENNTTAIDGIIFRIRLTNKTGRYEKSDSRNYFAT